MTNQSSRNRIPRHFALPRVTLRFLFFFFLWTAAQINENLATNPQLLLDKPETEGYIGIVLQRLGDSDVAHPQHLNQSDYDNL